MEDKKKTRYKNQSEWKKEHKDRIPFEVPKGTKEQLKEMAGNKSLNAFLYEIVLKYIEKGNDLGIKDLEAYARSAGTSAEEYIKAAVLEKMERQDAEYKETVTRIKEY